MRYLRAVYTIDEKDQLLERADFPKQDVGTPLPLVFATEQSLALACYLNAGPKNVTVFDATTHDRMAELARTADPGKRSRVE